MPITRRHPRRTAAEHGQATVEFALILPILCFLLFGAIQFGMAFWQYQQVSAAASEGARRAAVSRTYGDRAARAEAAAKAASPGLDSARMTVSTSSTWDAGDPVSVTVEYPVVIDILPLINRPILSDEFRVTRTMRVEQ